MILKTKYLIFLTKLLTLLLLLLKNEIPDHRKYITAPEFDKLTAEKFIAILILELKVILLIS